MKPRRTRVHGADAYPWLRPGDRVALAVDRLGTIDAAILPAAAPTPLS